MEKRLKESEFLDLEYRKDAFFAALSCDICLAIAFGDGFHLLKHPDSYSIWEAGTAAIALLVAVFIIWILSLIRHNYVRAQQSAERFEFAETEMERSRQKFDDAVAQFIGE